MSNNTAFGTAQPPKRPAGLVSSLADGIKEGSSAPVDPEWEAARYSPCPLYPLPFSGECMSSYFEDAQHELCNSACGMWHHHDSNC